MPPIAPPIALKKAARPAKKDAVPAPTGGIQPGGYGKVDSSPPLKYPSLGQQMTEPG
jgi:hypothetical protein